MLRAMQWRGSISRKLQARKEQWSSLKALRVNGSLWRGGRRTLVPSSSQWHWWTPNLPDLMAAKLKEGWAWAEQRVSMEPRFLSPRFPYQTWPRRGTVVTLWTLSGPIRDTDNSRYQRKVQKASRHLVKLNRRERTQKHWRGYGSAWEAAEVQNRD